jgi:hypothetical protein
MTKESQEIEYKVPVWIIIGLIISIGGTIACIAYEVYCLTHLTGKI